MPQFNFENNYVRLSFLVETIFSYNKILKRRKYLYILLNKNKIKFSNTESIFQNPNLDLGFIFTFVLEMCQGIVVMS